MRTGAYTVWGMNAVAQVLAVLVGLTIIGVGTLEAFFFRNQRFHSIFLIKPEDAEAVRLWVVNQGFYNIVWGLGALVGVLLLNVGDPVAGATLVFFVSGAHVIFGIVLGVTEPRLWMSMIAQSLLPLVVILTAVLLPA